MKTIKTTREFLQHLLTLGVQLWDDDGYLGYSGPDDVFTPALMAQLKQRKAEIMRFLQGAPDDLRSPISSVPRDGRLPLSFGQQRLWFLDQLGHGIAYNMPATLTLSGSLNVAALRQSLQEIVRRHESLRTTFAMHEGKPVQVIHPEMTIDLPVVDLRAYAPQEQALEIQRLAAGEAMRPFDLNRDPMLRATLLRLSDSESLGSHYLTYPEPVEGKRADVKIDTEHILLLTQHHIAADGWSIGILIRELGLLYAAFSQKQPFATSPLPDLPIQYADFAVWQRDYLQGEVLARQLGYWMDRLAGVPKLLQLPTDRARPAQQSFQGDAVQIELQPELTQALRRLSQQEGVTLYMSLLAAFQVLVSRYTGQNDVVIGSAIANRHRQEIEPLIGFFVNTLAMRGELFGADGQPLTVTQLLAQVKETTEAAYEHQDLPFERLVEELQLERTLNYNPLVQVIFTLQNTPMAKFDLPGLTVTPAQVGEQTTRFDLEMHVWEVDNQLQGECIYSTDLFDKPTIQRMMGHFHTLLAGMVADPHYSIAKLPLLTQAERHQILVEWNDTHTDYPKDKCIHQLFEEEVEHTPEAMALVFGNQEITYRELNHRANQLAHYLIRQGVGPETLVGICIERSVEMVVGLLAILKAGGAYVPLDPTLPGERLAFMLSDTNVSLLLTQSKFSFDLPPTVHRCDLDMEWAFEQNRKNPRQWGTSNNLAYIMYTSGSTGRPKGVCVTHQNVVRLVQNNYFASMSADEVFLQLAPISFDASTLELWGALLNGAKLVIMPPHQGGVDLSELAHILKRHRITTLWLTAGLFHLMVDEHLEALGTLRQLLAGGDVLSVPHVKKVLQRWPDCQLINGYGPTENTTFTTCCSLRPDTIGASVPIGKPIANTQVYILDEELQPVPVGVVGQLYAGGAGVARGYKSRPTLTEGKFIANPFGVGRLYKTGDLCRYLPDGDIQFVGRADYQVKIRGFRIELGEIEATLNSLPNVREAVVVVREESLKKGGVSKRLVAYIVGDVKELRATIKQKLPDYMIPSAFVSLEAMPLTPNGKIDRRALPDPDEVIDKTQQVLPRTPVETILASIWQEVLGLEQVGVTDNFFEVGGDSIISIQIVSRAKEAGIQLTPKALFQHQTIAELASVAKEVQKTNAEQQIVTGTLPLTPIQHWFLEQAWHEPHHFNQSFLLELTPDVNLTWLSEAVRALLTHHDALRLRFFCEGLSGACEGRWRQEIVAPEPDVPFEVIALSDISALALQKQANELQASLNLAPGPLVRVALFQSGTANRLLIVIHHLAVDGVSWRILLEDLQTAYQQLASGKPIQLPAKTTSFKQWATLLAEKGASVIADERDYWAQLSALYHDQSRLPVDYRLGANDMASAAHISTQLSRAQTQALLNEVPAVYHTQINDLLLTALLLVFQEWTGQPALLLNLEGHGREELFEANLSVDLSRTVGWFTTIFPVHLELMTGRLAVSELGKAIKSIKEQLRRIPNRGIGYGILRYLSGLGVAEVDAEVSFNYLGQFDQIASGTLIKAFATESSGLPYSQFGTRTHLLDINSVVVEGQLQVDWTYSRNFHQIQTVQKLANRFIDALQALIAHCQEPETGGYTPSDFPEAELNQEELDDLLSGLKL